MFRFATLTVLMGFLVFGATASHANNDVNIGNVELNARGGFDCPQYPGCQPIVSYMCVPDHGNRSSMYRDLIRSVISCDGRVSTTFLGSYDDSHGIQDCNEALGQVR